MTIAVGGRIWGTTAVDQTVPYFPSADAGDLLTGTGSGHVCDANAVRGNNRLPAPVGSVCDPGRARGGSGRIRPTVARATP
jgi:hypothetical protein